MTLQLLQSEFPYISGKFDFLFYQCIHDRRMILDCTLGSHSTLGSLTQDSMISCQASPVDDLNIKYMYYYIRCCYITVDSATTALQNGAWTYRCISKQMHYKTPFSLNGYMKNLEFYESYIILFCLGKKAFCQYHINSKSSMAYYLKWMN